MHPIRTARVPLHARDASIEEARSIRSRTDIHVRLDRTTAAIVELGTSISTRVSIIDIEAAIGGSSIVRLIPHTPLYQHGRPPGDAVVCVVRAMTRMRAVAVVVSEYTQEAYPCRGGRDTALRDVRQLLRPVRDDVLLLRNVCTHPERHA